MPIDKCATQCNLLQCSSCMYKLEEQTKLLPNKCKKRWGEWIVSSTKSMRMLFDTYTIIITHVCWEQLWDCTCNMCIFHTGRIEGDCFYWALTIDPASHWWNWKMIWCCDEQPRHYHSYSILHCNIVSSCVRCWNGNTCHVYPGSNTIYLYIITISTNVFIALPF